MVLCAFEPDLERVGKCRQFILEATVIDDHHFTAGDLDIVDGVLSTLHPNVFINRAAVLGAEKLQKLSVLLAAVNSIRSQNVETLFVHIVQRVGEFSGVNKKSSVFEQSLERSRETGFSRTLFTTNQNYFSRHCWSPVLRPSLRVCLVVLVGALMGHRLQFVLVEPFGVREGGDRRFAGPLSRERGW